MIEDYYCNGNQTFLEVVCPGIWFEIHILGSKCKNGNQKDIKKFKEKIEDLKENFFCINCRNHFNLLCKKIPLSDFLKVYDSNGNNIGPFKWTWIIHNKINMRLGKEIMPFKTADDMYSEVLGVTGKCSACMK